MGLLGRLAESGPGAGRCWTGLKPDHARAREAARRLARPPLLKAETGSGSGSCRQRGSPGRRVARRRSAWALCCCCCSCWRRRRAPAGKGTWRRSGSSSSERSRASRGQQRGMEVDGEGKPRRCSGSRRKARISGEAGAWRQCEGPCGGGSCACASGGACSCYAGSVAAAIAEKRIGSPAVGGWC